MRKLQHCVVSEIGFFTAHLNLHLTSDIKFSPSKAFDNMMTLAPLPMLREWNLRPVKTCQILVIILSSFAVHSLLRACGFRNISRYNKSRFV